MPKFDNNIKPQDDFFAYVNNDWLKNNPIPDKENRWGSFNILRDNALISINEIINDLINLPDIKLDHNQRLLKTYFKTALRYPDFDKNHLKTLDIELQKIAKINSKDEIATYLGHAHRHGISLFWNSFVTVDDKNSQNQVMAIHQGGLTLPNRDYYIEKTDRMKKIKDEYNKYFLNIINHLSNKNKIDWTNVFDIELKLAKSSWTDIKLRDTNKNYNKFTLNNLKTRFPSFKWVEYFQSQGWQEPDDNIVIGQPSFIDSVLEIINEKTLDEIKQYLYWQLIDILSKFIDEKSSLIRFNFYGKIINGVKERNPLWKRVIQQSDLLVISETLGKEYANKYFPETSKQDLLKMVEDIRKAYHNRLNKVSWMSEKTKKRAHKKLDNIKVLIGYPSTWLSMDELKLTDDNHLKNTLDCLAFYTDTEMIKIGKKPPVEDWHMSAHTVNAYFDPNQLNICFPAGILQPPFYDPKADHATNLGGIGSVIGHELTHGFDDQGSDFDEFGNMRKWQTNAERKKFKEMTKNIIKQANDYEIIPGIFLKGDLVIGEVIADIGGIELAIEALQEKTEENIKKILINFAIIECGAEREEYIVQQAKIDPHPVSKFRVNCTVMHIDEFYDIYKVEPSNKLYLPNDKRAHIW